MKTTRTPDPILTLLLAAGLAGCPAHAQNQQAAPSPPNWPAAVVQQLQRADFHACLGNIKAMALREGVPHSVADQALSGLTPDQRVLDLDSRQPEFTLTLARYLANAISPERIAKGRQMLTQ